MSFRTFILTICLSICLGLVSSSTAAQSLTHAWSHSFGDASEQFGTSVATDGTGNVYMTGLFLGTVDFGGGPLTSVGDYDLFVAKFDAAGNHLWSQRFGDPSAQYAYAVTTDGSDNVIVTGVFVGTVDFGGGGLTCAGDFDIFVAKFDAAGNHIWSRSFGDTDFDFGWSVATDGSDNVYLSGYFYGTVDFGGGVLTSAGYSDIFVAKFDAAGVHLWSQRFGNYSFQSDASVATDGSDNVIVGGSFASSIDFGGGPLVSAGQQNIYVVKFNSAGDHVWSQSFGDTESQIAHAVVTDGSDSILVTGFNSGVVDFGGGPIATAGTSDIFIVKLDAAGSHDWSQGFGDESVQFGQDLTVDGSGNVTVTGRFQDTVDFGGGPLTSAGSDDIFVARFDAAGIHLWSERFGDASSQEGCGITTDASGNVFSTGHFKGSVDFGGGPLTSTGSADIDIYVVKFNAAGPVPTLLQAFDAGYRSGEVKLAWRLTEIGREAEFIVLRSDAGRPFVELYTTHAEIRGLNGSVTDRTVEPGNSYRYRVDVSDEDWRHTLFVTSEIVVPATALSLGTGEPNPFNPQTSIDYTVPESAPVRLAIYDAGGRLVRMLVDGVVPPGAGSVMWNGRDDHGSAVSSGVYFVRLTSGKQVRTSKVVLLK